MADKTLYFLRHGEAESNAGGFYAGQSDVALTEKGIGQAKAAAPMLKNVKFDKIYCSDLQRAKRTAALALPDSECEYTALIREIDVGELSYQSIAECEKKYGQPYLDARAKRDYSLFGGESREQLEARASAFLHQIAALEDTPTVGAVCHGGFMHAAARVVLGDVNGLAMPDNCAVCVFVYKDGQWSLRRWNVTVEL